MILEPRVVLAVRTRFSVLLGSMVKVAAMAAVMVPAAAAVGLREEYAYLEKSLERFPDGVAQERMAREVGFTKAVHQPRVVGQMGVLLLMA